MNLGGYCDSSRHDYEDIQTNTNLFAQKYQFIVSMRNTSARNYTPIEMSDFRDHSIDLSSWFSIDAIVETKINWYKMHDIQILNPEAEKHLHFIMTDLGPGDDGTLRGLKPKMDLIFNHDKRLISSRVAQLLVESPEEHYLNYASRFLSLSYERSPWLSCLHFSYRSIIWRSVLDWLRHGDLFQKEVFAEYETDSGRIADTNYIYKILVVLHQFAVQSGSGELESRCTDRYMPFIELIRRVYNESGDFASRFFEEGFFAERTRIVQLLYYLNYFNRRDNNWFQFIDIQYNVDDMDKKHLKSSEDLMNIIESAGEHIGQLKIRITTAGKAYLGYIAPTFEFVSCMAFKRPLLSCLPTEEELEKYPIEKQTCYKVIQDVLSQIRKYISDFEPQQDNVYLLYRRSLSTLGETYPERLVKSSYGYLTNFIDTLNRLVDVQTDNSRKRKANLISWITEESHKLWSLTFPNSYDN